MVGIKELKNKLTHYLKSVRDGDNIVVTDRGAPIAIIHGLDQIEDEAGVEERLASLARRGRIRLPLVPGKLTTFKSIETTGKPASEIIVEERR
jgi:prevent-host-death family protein